MINFPHLMWPFALWYRPQCYAWLGFVKCPVEIILGILIRCQNRIFDMLPINATTRYGRPLLNVHFQLFSQWKRFSVPVERHRFMKSHDITLHASFHWHDKCHYETLEHVIVMIDHLKGERHHWQKDYFWTKSNHVCPVANNVVNPLAFDMSLLHDTCKSSWYSQSYLKEKILLLP